MVKRRIGDRKEGRLIRTLDPFYRFTPYIMRTRGDATNYFRDKMELDEAEKYLRVLRSQGYKGIGMLHLFIASYIRAVSRYPALNRFVAGNRIYARNRIEVIMTIKKEMTTQGGETSFKVYFTPEDTVFDVYTKMNLEIEKLKNGNDENSTEKAASALIRLPRFILRSAIAVIRWLDYRGWLPESLISASPFHGSLAVTDIGSLGIDAIYHHLYNFGDCPLFLAFGSKQIVNELQKDGSVVERRYINFAVSSDERICDGFYFATAFRYVRYLLKNPTLLSAPPREIVCDQA